MAGSRCSLLMQLCILYVLFVAFLSLNSVLFVSCLLTLSAWKLPCWIHPLLLHISLISSISPFYINDCVCAQWCLTLCDSVDCSPHQALLSMGFSRQASWVGLPFPSAWDLSGPGIKPSSPTSQADYRLSHLGIINDSTIP